MDRGALRIAPSTFPLSADYSSPVTEQIVWLITRERRFKINKIRILKAVVRIANPSQEIMLWTESLTQASFTTLDGVAHPTGRCSTGAQCDESGM